MKTSTDSSQVYNIAKHTRMWAEQYAARHHFPLDLMGLCGIASAHLVSALDRAKIRGYVIATNHNHCFVTDDEMIVDVTATQFSGIREAVVIKHKSTVFDDQYWWNIHTTCATAYELRRHLIRETWPHDQIPSSYLVRSWMS